MRAEKDKTISTKTLDSELKITSAKTELIRISKSFYDRGWMLGTSGNLSILIEPVSDFCFLITASGKDKGDLTEDDFILVDENANPISKSQAPCSQLAPSAETLLHAAIYKHTDARAVFHVHTINSTLLSNHSLERHDKPCSYISFSNLEMLKGLGFKTHDLTVNIPVIENSQDMKYLSSTIPSYINEEVPGFLLRGHGIYAWGKTPQEAKKHIEIFEFLFELEVSS